MKSGIFDQVYKRRSRKLRYQQMVPGMVRIIERDLQGRWDADMLGKRFGLRKNTVYRLLRQEAGMSATGIRNRGRIKEARRLLRVTRHPVWVVARRVGFRSRPAFYGVFKAKVGLNPGEYRRKFRSRVKPRSSAPGSSSSSRFTPRLTGTSEA